jgi:hypothetical protein
MQIIKSLVLVSTIAGGFGLKYHKFGVIVNKVFNFEKYFLASSIQINFFPLKISFIKSVNSLMGLEKLYINC